MADRGRFDENARTSLFAVSNDGNYTPVSLWADPTTHALLVNASVTVTGVATEETQTDGSQKTQIVDSDGATNLGTSSRPMQVSLANTAANATAVKVDGSAVTQPVSGTVSITANSSVNISQMNGVTVTMGNGASGTGVQRVTIANDSTGVLATVSTLTGSGIAHDAADSGNPHKIGLKAYSPDGTTPGTAVAELDRTDAKGDLDGRQYVNLEHPRWWSYHSDGSSALTDASVQSAPGAGFQLVITEIIFSTGAATACNIFFEEGATKILGPWYLEAVAGRGVVWRGRKHVTANTALTVTTSAAIAQSVDVQGYIQAV